MNETIKLRVAAKALIENSEGKVLILREASTYKDGANTGRYHLPGGRLNDGEAIWINPAEYKQYDIMAPEGNVIKAYLETR